MKIYRANIWHEAAILFLYVVLITNIYEYFSSEDATGGVERALMISALSAIFSIILISILKKKSNYAFLELAIWVIPFVITSVLHSADNYLDMYSDFFKSNIISICIIYSISMIYKLIKQNIKA